MSSPTRERGHEGQSVTVRRALVRFAALGSLALLLVSGATVVLANEVSENLALRHAKTRGISFARVVSAPLVNAGIRRGDGPELKRFAAVMRNRLRDGSMVHLTVWDAEGRVLWADQPQLHGRALDPEGPVARLATTGGAVASVEDLANDRRGRAGDGPPLEVYVATHDADGLPIIVETAWSRDTIDEDARAILIRFAVLSTGSLLLLSALVLPLAWSLARDVDRAQADSRLSLQRALAASDLERRRIARDVHDGVMQDVSGAGYALAAASRWLPAEAEGPREFVDQASAMVNHVGESLRSLMTDIYPPDLARDGLRAAVLGLANRAAVDGIRVDVDVDDLVEADLDVRQLCYRVVREALRNVARHAQATHVDVRVAPRNDTTVLLDVHDDGRGLDPGSAQAEGHLGLRILRDALSDVGGTLVVGSGPTGGTTLSATLPMTLSPRPRQRARMLQDAARTMGPDPEKRSPGTEWRTT